MAEPTVNQLITTTINDYHDTFADNVANSNSLTATLRKNGRVRVVDGGKVISTPLTYAEETFAWYSGTELLSRATKETISEADYAPANSVASVTLSGPDLAKNRGEARIKDLLEAKMTNAETTMANNITKAIYGDGTVAKSFAGLKAMITDAGTGTVGLIDSTTWTFWKNQFQSIARATGLQYPALKAGLNALWLKLVRGTEHPDLVIVDGEIYATYESGLQELQRYQNVSTSAGLGFETLQYKTASVVYDSAATGLVGGYMLNTKYFKLEIYRGYNFQLLDLPDQTPDMDATTRHIGFMGCLTLSNRSMQGRILLTGT